MAALTPMPRNLQQPMRSAIAESFGLNWLDLAPVLVHFRVALNKDNGEAGDTDYFRVPQGRKFLGWEMRAHIGMNAIGSEALSSTLTSPLALASVKERELIKAMNARLILRHIDMDKMEVVQTDVRNSSQRNVTLPLSALMFGGVQWCRGNDIAPLIVQEDNRLEAEVFLSDVTAVGGVTPAGEETEYGVTLVGALIRQSAT